jgi:hypothetical protein
MPLESEKVKELTLQRHLIHSRMCLYCRASQGVTTKCDGIVHEGVAFTA